MKIMRIATILACSAAALIGSAGAAAAASLQAPGATTSADANNIARETARLRDAERKRAQAVSNRDIGTLRDLISGEYYHVESNGRVRRKTEILQLLAREEFEFRSYEIDGMEITLLDNGRSAVVTGRLVAQMQDPARPREFRGRYVRMWTLGQHGWRNSLSQTTEIRPVAPTHQASL